MHLLDKLLGIVQRKDLPIGPKFYSLLYSKIEYSISSYNPDMDKKELLEKSKTLYYMMCGFMDCKCPKDMHEPVDAAMERLYNGGSSSAAPKLANYSS